MPGPSGYTSAFAHPDPLDPNDAQRQRTQTRAGSYPYDQPVSYGKATTAGDDQLSYQVDGGNRPPPGEETRPDRPLSVWDRLSDMTDDVDHDGTEDPQTDLRPVSVGMQGKDASSFGYGDHGLRDGMDPFELEMDALRRDFRDSYRETRPTVAHMGARDLFSLLMDLDPEYASERFAPEDDAEMTDIYDQWALQFGGPEEE